ncbi:peptidase M16 [bacterium SCGC AG-212-C10]|nr:peptidase M16 [bacterium SCGC AG-212-C10]
MTGTTQARTITPADGDILPFPATEATLANGLRVIVVPTGFPNLVSLQIPVQTGSRNEVEPGKSGFAHFFEHMMFRGTEKYSSTAYQTILTRSGARQNAYTTDDYTNYHITFAAEDLEQMLEVEADRFMNLKYSEEDFRTEARAILGEYNKSSSDPLSKLIEVQREHAFSTHTYQHTTMGFLRDIEDMPNQFDYSRTFFDRWYRPEYTAIVVAGDVDAEATIALVEKYWGAWERGTFTVEIPQEQPHEAPITAHVPWPSATLPFVSVAYLGPRFSETERDWAAMDTLLDLYFGPTSDLYRRLVEEEQKVDEFMPYLPANQDPSLASVFARVKSPSDAAYVRQCLLDTFAEARAKGVDPARLEEAKANGRYSFARTLDNSESIASTLARFVRYNRSYETLSRFYALFASLTAEDVAAAAKRYLTEANLVEATLSHEPLELTLDASVTPTAATASPGDATVPTIQLKSPSKLLSFKLLFDAGSAYDPAGKEGLAELTASMITEAGSETMRVDEITRALFPIAGNFYAHVDREMVTFNATIHADNLGRFADIVLPQLLRPGFRDSDFTRLKESQLNQLVQDLRSDNDEEFGKERLQANIFAASPYGHPTVGTVAGIEAITLDDVRDFAATMYTRANLTLGVAGDIPEAFLARLNRELTALPEGTKPESPVVIGSTGDGMQIEIVQKETRATAISFGHLLQVTRNHPDFAALWLVRSWIGEHRASQGRLFQKLREARGLNYGNYAYIEAFPGGMYQFFPSPNLARRAQLFEVWIRPVPPEHGVFALKAALFELRQLLDRGLDEASFESTREYLMKNVFLMTKTQDQQLGYALDDAWYGTGEFVTTMREKLAALTLDGVNTAMRAHLSGTNLNVVMITKDADGLRDELLADTFTAITYDSAKPEDLLAEDRLIGALNLALTPERVKIVPATDVFA